MFSRENIVTKPIMFVQVYAAKKKKPNCSYHNSPVNNLVRTFLPFTRAQQVPLLIQGREISENAEHVM